MQLRRTRIALYSHDAMGLGHMRRNHRIAAALARGLPGADVLLVAGAGAASAFPMPPGVDCLTLPALAKRADGRYGARGLHVGLHQLTRIRGRAIEGALDAFDPHLFIVDKHPRGCFNELDDALARLRRKGRVRCVLGLRDVLDDPETVRREWEEAGSEAAIRTYYDAVWIYGDPTVYDPLTEYGLPTDIAERTRFCGYIGARPPEAEDAAPGPGRSAVRDAVALCQVGGGQDGARLAESFAAAERPAGMGAVILTGPYMPSDARDRLRALQSPSLRIHEFVAEPADLLHRVERVVSMGGYNSVCELLTSGKPALVVPRTTPRQEQRIRAERLRDLGAIEMALPEDASADLLSCWLSRDPPAAQAARERIDFHGLDRLPDLVHEVLTASH